MSSPWSCCTWTGRDTVTVQAYHKLIFRLVLDGRLAEAGDPDADAQRYKLAPAMHADTALTLDDVDLITATRKPTQAIAMLIDAREYVGANQKTVLRKAALELQKVDPRVLVRDMIVWKVSHYNMLVDEWRVYGKDDERHRRIVEAARRELEKICYSRFGLSADAVRLPPPLASPTTPRATPPSPPTPTPWIGSWPSGSTATRPSSTSWSPTQKRPPTGPTSSWPEATAAPTPA